MIPFYNGSSLQNCAIVRFCNQPISEEADRRIALPRIQITSLTHRETISEISELINLISEPGWQSTLKREFIEGSGIDTDLFEAAISIIEDTGYWEPNELLGQNVSRQWQTRKPQSYGALAVLSNEDSSLWQAKPQNPRIDKKGKPQRYETPVGNGSRAFLPAVTVRIWSGIASKHNLEDKLPSWVKRAVADGNSSKKSSTDLPRIGGEILLPEREPRLKPTGFISLDTKLNPSLLKPCSRAINSTQPDGQKWSTETILADSCPLPCNPTGQEILETRSNIEAGISSATDTLFGSSPIKNGSNHAGCYQGKSFWTWVERHPEIQIIITEGGKKSLSLLSQGYVAIALYGVDGGGLFNEWINGEKLRKLKPELIADLQPFAVSGRQVTLAFDQDESTKTRSQVSAALDRLGGLLRGAGCKVSIAQWDGQNGRCKGVDDLIVSEGVAAWETALCGASSFSQWSIARRLTREVRRKPDLNIGDREFHEVADQLPKSGIVAFYGGKGSGKSKAIAELLKWQKWLSITHLSSLGRDQAAGWGGVFVNDGDRHGSKLLKDGVPVNGGSVCVPSLLKVSAVDADVLVLDETSATLEFILGSKLANKDGMRPLLLTEFYQRVRAARLVLLACADMSEEALQFIESIRGERAYLVKSERKALTYEATIIDGSLNAAIVLLQQRIEKSDNDTIFYINADSKARAEMFAELLGRDQTLLITGDTSGGEVQASFLASKGRDLPGLVAQGVRFIISSPSVTQGFSIEHHTDLIDSVWGFYSGCSISAHSIAQAPDRIRNSNIPRFFWIANKGSATSRLSKAQSITTFLKEFRQLNSAAARLVAHSLMPDTAIEVDRIDWQSQNLRMLAALEVRRNQGMFQLKETLIALLQKEGKRVSICKPQISKVELSAIGAIVNRASSAVKTRHHEAVVAAATIDKVEAKALSEQSEPLTPDQVLSLEKFYIAEFYRLDEVAVSDVAFDKKGATRSQIKALEAVLSPQLATETTARTINQNPENPQDWNPIVVRSRLQEQCGAAALMRGIVAGEVSVLTPELTSPIAAFIRAHEPEFRIAFNFRNVAALSDQQIMGEILSRHGIKTKRRGKVANKRYEVCKPELEAILSIVERRKTEVTPLLTLEVNQRGVTRSKSPENLEKWLTPESLNEIRELWKLADCPESQSALRQVIPIEVLERAIS